MIDGRVDTFPTRAAAAVRVDSVAEEYAYIAAWPSASGPWQRVNQLLAPGSGGPEDHLTLRAPDGSTVVLRFAIGTFFGRPDERVDTPGARVEAAMRAGHQLARDEGPLHPGTMPFYPVPSPSLGGAVAVPLPLVAADAGRRGLYAPPRIAVVRWPSAEAVGVGDAPGFDSTRWPPPFLGDWPPTAIRDWDGERLAGAIERFTSLWGRLLDDWFGGERYGSRDDELHEARLLLRQLVPEGLLDVYRDLSPEFWRRVDAADNSESDQTP